MSFVLKFNKNKNPNVLKLGVLYSPSSIPSKPNVTNYLYNEYFLKMVDTIVGQLSINDILLVGVPVNLPTSLAALDELTKKSIYTTLSKYTDITYFICSFGSEQLEILQEVYFKFNKKITLLSTSSSKTSLKFNDNILRFLPYDYTLVNFISNYFLKDTEYYYDCVFIGGSFYELEGKPVFGNSSQISETIAFINDYLYLSNRYLEASPIITNNDNNLDIRSSVQSIFNILDNNTNPNYYHTNCYSNYIMQYIQNSTSNFSTPEQQAIFNQWLKDYPNANVTNWKIFESYLLPDLTTDNNKWAIINYFVLYITLFDYTQKKKILLFMSNFQFPAFLSILTHLIPTFENAFGKTDILNNFKKKSRIIFTNTQNRNEFTSELLSDVRTDTLWYNMGKTWMDLLDLYNPMIFLPRYDQSINIFINKLSLELNMYNSNNTYIDLSVNSPVALIPIYNAIQFVYHFYKNGLNINNFTLNYFLKSNLLYFGNNLIFDENMDNVFNIIIGTSYFNSTNTIINRSLMINRDTISNLELNLDELYDNLEEYKLDRIYEPSDKTNWKDFYDTFKAANFNNNTKNNRINDLLKSPFQTSYISQGVNYTFALKVNLIINNDNKSRIRNILEYVISLATNPFTLSSTTLVRDP